MIIGELLTGDEEKTNGVIQTQEKEEEEEEMKELSDHNCEINFDKLLWHPSADYQIYVRMGTPEYSHLYWNCYLLEEDVRKGMQYCLGKACEAINNTLSKLKKKK